MGQGSILGRKMGMHGVTLSNGMHPLTTKSLPLAFLHLISLLTVRGFLFPDFITNQPVVPYTLYDIHKHVSQGAAVSVPGQGIMANRVERSRMSRLGGGNSDECRDEIIFQSPKLAWARLHQLISRYYHEYLPERYAPRDPTSQDRFIRPSARSTLRRETWLSAGVRQKTRLQGSER